MLSKRLIFALVIMLLVLPGPVAYGYDNVVQDPVRIEAVETPAEPAWQAFPHAAGSINRPLDIFYVHADEDTAPLTATLHITNVDELIHCYRYFVLEIGVYAADGAGGWTEAGQMPLNTSLNLRNGSVSFPLDGATEYKVGIKSGSFYCIATGDTYGKSSLRFSLEINEATEA